MEELSKYIAGMPLWLLIIFCTAYAGLWIAFIILLIRMWRKLF